jgi:heme oxygenase
MKRFIQVVLVAVLACACSCQAFAVVGTQQHRMTTPRFSTSTDDLQVENEEEVLNPRLAGLALQLDEGTRKSHSVAQNSAFVTGFFKGLSTRNSYRALITSLYFVYQAMEQAFDDNANASDDETSFVVQALDDPALRRLAALEQDLEYFYASEWKKNENKQAMMNVMQPSPATQAYVARIQEVAQTQPYLLVAHQYTRYLGDLFGT